MSAAKGKIKLITRCIFVFYLFGSVSGCGESKFVKQTNKTVLPPGFWQKTPKKAVPDETKVSIALVAEAVRYFGDLASKKYLPLIEKLHRQLNQDSIPLLEAVLQAREKIIRAPGTG